jgi:hypothetical protein
MEVLGYGVCRLSLVSVRQAPKEYAPLVTQLLFGDHYEVINVPIIKIGFTYEFILMDRKGGLMPSNIMVLRTNTLNRSITPILRLLQT